MVWRQPLRRARTRCAEIVEPARGLIPAQRPGGHLQHTHRHAEHATGDADRRHVHAGNAGPSDRRGNGASAAAQLNDDVTRGGHAHRPDIVIRLPQFVRRLLVQGVVFEVVVQVQRLLLEPDPDVPQFERDIGQHPRRTAGIGHMPGRRQQRIAAFAGRQTAQRRLQFLLPGQQPTYPALPPGIGLDEPGMTLGVLPFAFLQRRLFPARLPCQVQHPGRFDDGEDGAGNAGLAGRGHDGRDGQRVDFPGDERADLQPGSSRRRTSPHRVRDLVEQVPFPRPGQPGVRREGRRPLPAGTAGHRFPISGVVFQARRRCLM